jgi:hypothetical protein
MPSTISNTGTFRYTNRDEWVPSPIRLAGRPLTAKSNSSLRHEILRVRDAILRIDRVETKYGRGQNAAGRFLNVLTEDGIIGRTDRIRFERSRFLDDYHVELEHVLWYLVNINDALFDEASEESEEEEHNEDDD